MAAPNARAAPALTDHQLLAWKRFILRLAAPLAPPLAEPASTATPTDQQLLARLAWETLSRPSFGLKDPLFDQYFSDENTVH